MINFVGMIDIFFLFLESYGKYETTQLSLKLNLIYNEI